MPGMTRSSRTRATAPRSGPSRICQGLLAALGGLGLVAQTLDRFLEDAALDWIVVDDQDELGHVAGYSTQQGPRIAGWCEIATQDRTDGHASLTRQSEECTHMGKCIVSLRLALMLFCDGRGAAAIAGQASPTWHLRPEAKPCKIGAVEPHI